MNEDLVNRFERAVDRMARINYVESQIMCAKAEWVAMITANNECDVAKVGHAYTYDDFMGLANKYQIHHNAVLEQTL